MRLLPADLPERAALAMEIHARPPEPLLAPGRASYIAVLVDADERERELAHLGRLCRQHAQLGPGADAVHWSGTLGTLRLKWERHGEFSSYTLLMPSAGPVPFAETAAGELPSGWLAGVPGLTVYAGHAELLSPAEGQELGDLLRQSFGDRTVVGSALGDGAGLVYSDFLIHADGFGRLLMIDQGFTPLVAGRMLQRLFEIEAYRMMALLAFPLARRLSPRLLAIERSLASLADSIAAGPTGPTGPAGQAEQGRHARLASSATPVTPVNQPGRARESAKDEQLLQELTRLAAEIESGLAASQFRFAACRAYAELVRTRIDELRERRLTGLQTIDEFMSRRFTPAVATCATVSRRMHDLSERVAQASHLLSTRVDIVREQQNLALLASMDRRAKLQLRLQQTVEGLSIAAIVYYMAGVVGYVAKGGRSLGLKLDVDLFVGLSVPLLALLAFNAVRRARRHASEQDLKEGH
ncbi:DUF3422 family protein [Roseateles terrae]|uniref:Membrane-anchored protein n=1 Tax=Roseateles terrae TaxID=431060 RepID=A0ABR6GUK6_9BURK|nr:DUF3422 domain-containing protein [Roseateles terrae]MBB3195759.1 putative membrane-anchored protein [Roseateles terrae]OWQ86649.1 hypothetical protein CDN98_13030 [Roseateles terrae]